MIFFPTILYTRRSILADDSLKLFGFEIKRANNQREKEQLPSIVPPLDDDGAGYITASGSHYGSYVDLSGEKAKDDKELIEKYRIIAQHPEVDAAIEDIVNEVISGEDQVIDLNLDNIDTTDQIKEQIKEEFSNITAMLDFQSYAHDIFRRYYVDGRIYHHLVVDSKKPQEGIQEIRPIDATKIRKIKEIKKEKDSVTGANIIKKVDEYYIFTESGSELYTASKGLSLIHI